MRLFVAVQLDKKMKDALCAVQNEMRRRGVEGNYTRPENLHLTLAFIGDYPDPDTVLEAMEDLRFQPFDLELKGLGSFGELWWAGLEGSENLEALARQLRRTLAEAAIPFDRKSFRPHVTLIRQARYRNDPRFDSISVQQARMTVDRISLMLSTRGKNGMIYTELGGVPAASDGKE